MRFQPGEGPSRGLLRDCTTGCGTDGLFYSTSLGAETASQPRQDLHQGLVGLALDLGQLNVELHAPLPRTRLEREPSLLLSFADRGQLEEISTHNQLNATKRLVIILD